MALRWEYNSAPSSPNGTLPFTVVGLNNLATMTLAPPGTPLWHPQKDDFAPRLGVAWQPFPNLVLRAGAGIFYDLGYSAVANGASAFPFVQQDTILSTSFPLSAAAAAPPPFTTSSPAGYMAVVDPNHVLPRTYEWNAAVERILGKAGILTVTYLGAAGRKLMRQDIYYKPNPNFTGEFEVMSNDADSSYQALQAQFRHRLAHGLQTLFSYTWAHAIDDASSDAYFVNLPASDAPLSQERGSSDYDIRQTFSSAVSYNIPAAGSGIWKSIFGSWSTDSIVYARTAPPVNVVTGQDPFAFGVSLSGAIGASRPDLVPGVPLWIANPNVAGGKEINKAAFSVPTGPRPRKSGTKRPARIRRHAGRSDAAEGVQTPGAAFASGASRSFQPLQPPKFRAPNELPEFSSIRTIDADAGSIARKRRPEWRPQSAVSNRRTALRATGPEAGFLTHLARATAADPIMKV